MGRFATLGSKIWGAKYGMEKIGSRLFSVIREEVAWPLRLQIASGNNLVQTKDLSIEGAIVPGLLLCS